MSGQKNSSRIIKNIGALCILLAGILGILNTFNRFENQMRESHYDHVNDLTVSADRNLSKITEGIYHELDLLLAESEEDIIKYLETGNEDGLRSRIWKSP